MNPSTIFIVFSALVASSTPKSQCVAFLLPTRNNVEYDHPLSSLSLSSLSSSSWSTLASHRYRAAKRNNSCFGHSNDAVVVGGLTTTSTRVFASNPATSPSSSTVSSLTVAAAVSSAIVDLKRVLTRAYATFFNPMATSWYAPDVSFDDPLTSFTGVESYKNNVDMLAGRTMLGRVMFDDACIILHSVTGGEVTTEQQGREGSSGSNVHIADIVTRWTLRVTVKVLPWKPVSRHA